MPRKPFYVNGYVWRNALTFAHPFTKDGAPRVYTSILLYLKEQGAATKKEILINGLGRTEALYTRKWYREHDFDFKAIPFREGGSHGYLSTMFSDMSHAGLIQWFPKMKVWTLGPRYEEWKEWLRKG